MEEYYEFFQGEKITSINCSLRKLKNRLFCKILGYKKAACSFRHATSVFRHRNLSDRSGCDVYELLRLPDNGCRGESQQCGANEIQFANPDKQQVLSETRISSHKTKYPPALKR